MRSDFEKSEKVEKIDGFEIGHREILLAVYDASLCISCCFLIYGAWTMRSRATMGSQIPLEMASKSTHSIISIENMAANCSALPHLGSYSHHLSSFPTQSNCSSSYIMREP